MLTETGRGQTATLDVTVRMDAVEATIQMTVTGLDELQISQLGDTTLEASDLDPLYSRIIIDDDIRLTGADPVRLVATAEIRLQASVSANGEDASGKAPGQGGPGGCAGGEAQTDGGCGDGGGRGNRLDDGAAGGGHFSSGTPGGGVPSSSGGEETGRPDLVPLAGEAGNGGGGSTLGAGGGGGGIVELTSHGAFVVDDRGSVAADGGRGGPGQCDDSVVGGSGGGGSGGAILLRAWDGFDDQIDQIDELRLSVRGGSGGDMPPDNTCVEVGGEGAFGRVRVDTAGLGGLPGFVRVTPEPFQGPLFRNVSSDGTPVVVVTGEQEITLEVVGERGTDFTLDVNGTTQAFSTSSDGTASVTASLEPGRNQICAKTSASTPLDVSEGVQCISIVSIQ